jgi:hypothetical protein
MSDTLQLAVTGAPLPEDFAGTPQDFYEAILERMQVIFPTGQTSFVISDTEPSTNLGPWLKEGTQWYVWDEGTNRYVPLDISPSMKVVTISESAPSDGTKPLWLEIKGTRFIRWHTWISGAWRPLTSRGTTAQRPSDPVDYERYFDTDIGTEIIYYGAAWHTVSGVPGDVKYVVHTTLTAALAANPGWQELGQYLSSDNARGRALVPAHKDAGGSPVTNFSPAAGITSRAARDTFGSETHVLTAAETVKAPHQHLLGVRKDSGSNDIYAQLIASKTFTSAITGADKLEILGDGSGNGLTSGNLTDGDLVTSNAVQTDAPVANDAHNNIQPSMALFCLVKL